jgi:hypothetical protein
MPKQRDCLELLRHVVSHLSAEPLQAGTVTAADLSRSRFAKAKFGPAGTIGILREGGVALTDFAEALLESSPRYQRGVTFSNELADVIIGDFQATRPEEISAAVVSRVEQKIEAWFQNASATHELYVPCSLTPRYAPAFTLGPVRFIHVDEFIRQGRVRLGALFDESFHQTIEAMQRSATYWMATVTVEQCVEARAWELGELTVDLALAGIQLVVPYDSDLMARMTARTIPRHRYTVSSSNGAFKSGVAWQLPGQTMGAGVLEQVLTQGRNVLQAVGPRIDAFLSRESPLGALDQAWVDAAYCFHEGLAEPLDTIAVSKFETAIEVLLRAESASGSKRRILQALDAFYGLTQDQPINPASGITVEQFAIGIVTDRSRVLHGTWSTLNHFLKESRPILERLVGNLLVNYVVALDMYAATSDAADDLEGFLSYAKSVRPTASAASNGGS